MDYPYVVIGAGAAGLVIAMGLAKAGKKVLLIERGHWGGDCTNYGCIPSKALIAAAERKDPQALEKVRKIVREVRSHEDPDALKKLGIETLEAEAHFVDPHTIQANGQQIKAKKTVIATGSSPVIPKIEGLEGTPYLTNETVFDLKEPPKSMIVIGGGPIGCELAQAFQKLGSQISLVHSQDRLLAREPKEASDALIKRFENQGMKVFLNLRPQKLTYSENQFTIESKDGSVQGEQLLVATGRKVNVDKLALENAQITYSDKGIAVDRYGRTTQKHIFAVGDIQGPPFFTHRAENQARSVLTTLLLSPLLKKRISCQPIPRATFTDPEVASIGLAEEEAIEKYGQNKIATYFVPFTGVDRAIAQDRTEGFVKIITKKWSSRIVGASIIAPSAGEMLGEISVAIAAKYPLRKLASIIHPYPAYTLAIRKAADMWLTQTILPTILRKKI